MNKREFCGSRNGFMVNQYAMRSGSLTYKELIVLYKLIDQFVYIERECPEKLVDGEWFYFLGDSAYEWLGMTAPMFSKAITALKEKGLISIRNIQPQGQLRPKNYYKVEYDAITELENKDKVAPVIEEEGFPNEEVKVSKKENLKLPKEALKNNINKKQKKNKQSETTTQKPAVVVDGKTSPLIVENPLGGYITLCKNAWFAEGAKAGYPKHVLATGMGGQFLTNISQMRLSFNPEEIIKLIELYFSEGFKPLRDECKTTHLKWFFQVQTTLCKAMEGGKNTYKSAKVAQDADWDNLKKPNIK